MGGYTCFCNDDAKVVDENSFKEHMKEHLLSSCSAKDLNNDFRCPICGQYRISRTDIFKDHLGNFHPKIYQDIFKKVWVNKNKKQKKNNSETPDDDIMEFSIEPSCSTGKKFSSGYEKRPIEVLDYSNPGLSEKSYQQVVQEKMNYDISEIPRLLKFTESVKSKYKSKKSKDQVKLEKEFAEKANELRSKTKVAQSHLNLILSECLKFIEKMIIDDNLNLENIKVIQKIANSTYYQEKYSQRIEITRENNNCYLNLRQTLEYWLKQEEICEQLYHHNIRPKDKKIIRNLMDVECHCPRKSDEIRIYLGIYIDDFSTKKFLSGYTGNTSITAVYSSIVNIDYEYQSKRNQICLLAIGKSKEILEHYKKGETTKVPYFTIFFDPVFEQLNNINKEPIILESPNGSKYKCNILVGLVIADNKASNSITGLPEAFYNTENCLKCYINLKSINENEKKSHSEVGKVRILSREDHLFKKIDYLKNIQYLYGFDFFHDFNEGLIKDLMNEILNKISCEDLIPKLESLRQKTKFDLPCIKKNKQKFYISGTGAQILKFFYVFSIIKVSLKEDSYIYKQYLLARKIVNFFLCPVVHVEETQDFRKVIDEYLKLNKINNFNLKPKTHHILHYIDEMMNLGPLIFTDTIKYERVHKDAKDWVAPSTNSVNLPYSIAKYFSFDRSKFDHKEEIYETILGKNIKEFDQFEIIENFVNLTSDLSFLKLLEVDKKILEINNFYLYKFFDKFNYPVFFKIEFILKQKTIKVLGKIYNTEKFIEKEYSYVIKEIDKLVELDVYNLPHFKKLLMIEKENKYFINKDFHIPNREIIEEHNSVKENFEKININYQLSQEDQNFTEITESCPELIEKFAEKIWKEQNNDLIFIKKFDISILRKDLKTLSLEIWVNDTIIDFYFNLLVENFKDKVFTFSCLFFTKLIRSNFEGVKNWYKNIKIFDFETVFVPIVQYGHWTLITINFNQKEINFYNSLNEENQHHLNIVLNYLEDYCLFKEQTFNRNYWKLKTVKNLPQQENNYDCGVYICIYAKLLCLKREIDFHQSIIPFERKKMVFEIVKGKVFI